MSKVALIIPCYNEEKRLHLPLFESFIKENDEYHYIFVNDGSKDNTLSLLNNFQSEYPSQVFVVNNESNIGKGNSIRAGVLYGLKKDFQIIGFLDADLATPLEEAKRLIEILVVERHLIMVIGSRVNNILGSNIRRNWFRVISSKLLSKLFQFTTKIIAYDTQCGAKFFKREICEVVFNEKFLTRWLFDIEMLLRINLSQYDLYKDCRESPIYFWRDVGDSKLSLFDSVGIFKELLRIKKNYEIRKYEY